MMNKVLIVIVLYKCRFHESISYKSVIDQLDGNKSGSWTFSFLFYDNSPEYNSDVVIPYFYVGDNSNGGISIAYNTGAVYARENDFNWLIFLDQDTTIPSDFIYSIISAIEGNPSIQVFVPRVYVEGLKKFISPGEVSLYRTIPHCEIYNGTLATKNMGIINSGLCISLDTFINCGGYENGVYLDFSDTVFFSKLKRVCEYFYVLDVDFLQNFSALEKDSQKAIERFIHYCRCARNFPKESLIKKVSFIILVFGKTIKMSFRYRSFSFINVVFNEYF